ncbi:2-(3-amino-3-carboxypropyl)histidine synthase subunit 1-like [Agrilus planipennis]|uniref:2-(3-amino-3-carboxypropyl)histidine synthase subunit 1 n=1 Tax=Agrilus planipennis TaxID=224129 RepID=A0A1W4XK29_AGRPL|nr:2-(3-amino-3-carboxypropyl)histidine synthase subunit 1 [Agrilus planipennis]XP_025830917.1 2-(3-amino-3-carboxypropyl)histidine synthase subunit 1-like [Agrilus planipennis]
MEQSGTTIVRANAQRKIFTPIRKISKVPEQLLKNEKLKAAISKLPKNYNFEIAKSVWRIQEANATLVALQMPEGLLMFATTIADIISEFTQAEVIIMGDVTYGACCIDDFTARIVGVDLLIHYGHSCLIPITQTSSIKVLYVFVDIEIDLQHCIETLKLNFNKTVHVALVSTVQFIRALQSVAKKLIEDGYNVTIPQCKPLSPGEILGCTAPTVKCADVILYVGDGRFHLEAVIIANPNVSVYKYDPYEKKITKELYQHDHLYEMRKSDIMKASKGNSIGIILGTLGRQGNVRVFNFLHQSLQKCGKTTISILLSEIFPLKLNLFQQVDAFVQTACPRLSIDWGKSFLKPLLTPYESALLNKQLNWSATEGGERYAMDFYANDSLGPWTPNHSPNIKRNNKCCGKCLQ